MQQRRVPPGIGFATAVVHVGGAREHLGDVDAGTRRGKEAHRAQHREAAGHARRHREIAKAFVVHDLPQRAVRRVRRHHDVPLVVDGAELLQQQIAHDQELAHRLRRLARLADDVEERAPQVERREQAGERHRIGIVGDMHPHLAVARRPRRMFARPQRRVERARPEHRSPDPQHDEVVELPPHVLREPQRALQLGPRIRQVRERQHSRAPLPIQHRMGLRQPRRELLDLARGDSSSDRRRDHRIHINAYALRLAPLLLPIPACHQGGALNTFLRAARRAGSSGAQ